MNRPPGYQPVIASEAKHSPLKTTSFQVGFRLFLGLAILAILALAVRDIPLGDALEVFHRANWGWAAAALGMIVVNSLAKVLRWKLLLQAGANLVARAGNPDGGTGSSTSEGPNPSLLPMEWKLIRLGKVFMAGQLLNLALPGRLGDVGRVIMARRRGGWEAVLNENFPENFPQPGTRSLALGTLVVEKVLDLGAYGLLAVGLLVLLPLPGWAADSTLALAWIGGGALVGLSVITWQRRRVLEGLLWAAYRLPERFHLVLVPRLRAALAALAALSRPADLAWLVGYTAGVWVTAVLTNTWVLKAAGLALPLAASLVVLVLLQAGISLYAVPGHIGVFEFLCILALGVFGVSSAQALGFGLLLHALLVAWIVCAGGLAWLGLLLERRQG